MDFDRGSDSEIFGSHCSQAHLNDQSQEEKTAIKKSYILIKVEKINR